ncbi:hypothetical protein [Pyrobaculum calidifontis]|uniref:Uncharacterized protein n=1 Tax=Pyrobaculum calidifontis (strain DSM 21063 / JCM 11548 / VA1) TaxID=410359 RepID=A3MWB2_PYRCJ|nr:hypothetical protein [Pyrobaculum calidifontis]ABO08929.1 conserved hypothetical protein [Pyrobaculum calidifontis JCM 11548]
MEEETPRTTIPVEGDVAKEASALAKSQRLSLIRFSSDALRLAVELFRRGISPSRGLEMFRLVELALAFDVVPVPLPLLELFAEKWGVCEDGDVAKALREMGARFGQLASARFTFPELVQTAAQFFALFPTARLSFTRRGETWRIVFIAPGEKSAKCLATFAEEAIRQWKCQPKIAVEKNVITAEITCG